MKLVVKNLKFFILYKRFFGRRLNWFLSFSLLNKKLKTEKYPYILINRYRRLSSTFKLSFKLPGSLSRARPCWCSTFPDWSAWWRTSRREAGSMQRERRPWRQRRWPPWLRSRRPSSATEVEAVVCCSRSRNWRPESCKKKNKSLLKQLYGFCWSLKLVWQNFKNCR